MTICLYLVHLFPWCTHCHSTWIHPLCYWSSLPLPLPPLLSFSSSPPPPLCSPPSLLSSPCSILMVNINPLNSHIFQRPKQIGKHKFKAAAFTMQNQNQKELIVSLYVLFPIWVGLWNILLFININPMFFSTYVNREIFRFIFLMDKEKNLI